MRMWLRFLTMVPAAAVAVLALSSASAAPPDPSPGPSNGKAPSSAAPSIQQLAALRPQKSEAVFVPIRPCRIADTRRGGGKLGVGAARNFYVRGTTGFAPQGGTSGGCGVPAGATGVTANVTVTGAGGKGYLKGYPYGTAETITNFISYWGDRNVTANPTFALAAVGTNPHLTIKNYGSTAYVIIDVTGYYIPQIEGMIAPDGSVYAGSTRIVSATHNGTGNYTVTIDSDVSNCTPTVTAYSGHVYGSAYGFNNNKVQVFIWRLSGGTETAYDGYFYVDVTC